MNQWLQDAIALFIQCQSMFRTAGDMALERRQVAEEALRRADERLAESEETARNADAILQGGIQ